MNPTTSTPTEARWLARRTASLDSSGIRRPVFDLAKQLRNPVDLSIGQVDYPVPEPVQETLIESVRMNRTGYTQTQGIGPLRTRLQQEIDAAFPGQERAVFVSSGTSGGLVLAALTLLDPGDEVIFLDPFFVMYRWLPGLVGAVPVPVQTWPDFRLDIGAVEAAITPRTKMMLVNSPSNPTGASLTAAELEQLVALAQDRDICIVSDEIYSKFVYDGPHVSPATFGPKTIVVDGFSKSHAMTGLRLGYVHGPPLVIEEMIKIQQFTFVCAPQPVQWAGITALDTPIDHYVKQYRAKRDFLYDVLSRHYDIVKPSGSFYMFPRLPAGVSGDEFVRRAVDHNLLIIPGYVFSTQDSHFRISFAVSDEQLDRGAEILKKIAK